LLLFWFTHSVLITGLGGLACCVLFCFPIDRFLDDRRETKKL
jgi:hypothetical protein